MRGGGSTVCVDSETDCIDSKPVCEEQEEDCDEQDCTPKPPCDSAPPTECPKSDCDEQPTPQQARQKVFEKIASLLRSVGFECDFDYEECETPKTDCESSEKQSRGNRWEESCNDNSPKYCDERQSDAQERRGYSNNTDNCRVVERCKPEPSWCDSAVPARYR